MRKKSKHIPKINKDSDLSIAFGIKKKMPISFADELATNLPEQNLSKILKEKSGSDRTPQSRREIIKLYPPPQDELDLHSLTRDEAEKKTAAFIRLSTSLKLRTVRIITGKGLHSNGPAVLPDVVETMLKELKSRELIFDFSWANKEQQKSGSLLVYLV